MSSGGKKPLLPWVSGSTSLSGPNGTNSGTNLETDFWSLGTVMERHLRNYQKGITGMDTTGYDEEGGVKDRRRETKETGSTGPEEQGMSSFHVNVKFRRREGQRRRTYKGYINVLTEEVRSETSLGGIRVGKNLSGYWWTNLYREGPREIRVAG